MLRADIITKRNSGTTERQTFHFATHARIEFDSAFIARIIHFTSHGDFALKKLVLHHVRVGNEKVISTVFDGTTIISPLRIGYGKGFGRQKELRDSPAAADPPSTTESGDKLCCRL